MEQKIGIAEMTAGPTAVEASMGNAVDPVFFRNADIVVALPGSGKTKYAKLRRGKVIDLDINGTRYLTDRRKLRTTMTALTEQIISDGLQVLVHPHAVNWEILQRTFPGSRIAYVLPASDYTDVLQRRVIERGGDPEFLADVAAAYPIWRANALAEVAAVRQLGFRVQVYFLNLDYPYLTEFWIQTQASVRP